MIEELKGDKYLWNLFTQKEAYFSSKLDKYQRFSYSSSEHKNVFEPEVSQFLKKKGFSFSWPNDKKFVVCLTHDIDNIFPSLKNRGYSALKLMSRLQLKRGLKRFFNQENPYWNLREIITLEEKYDAKSSFFFMTDQNNYDIRKLEDELKNIVKNGCEVGLHGGYNSYNDFNLIVKEKTKLEQILRKNIIGYRNHFLRFKIPETWELLSKAGFKYDTTLAYAEMIGFRNGMCHPFNPFNLNNNREIDILEIPLIIMDGTLRSYMNLNVKESWQMCKKLIDTANNMNGVITILWHNHYFDDILYKGWKNLYEKILKYSYEKNAWMTSGGNIWKWWTQKT